MRVSLALFDGLPLLSDDAEGMLAILGRLRVDEPAPDDHARASDPSTAVHCGDAAAPLVAAQDREDLEHVVAGLGEGAVVDGELVVLDVADVDAVGAHEGGEMGVVRGELAALCEVDERPHAGSEQLVQLLDGGALVRGPGVLAGEEERSRPV